MEETNNESIEKKLAYLNETKGLIKSAIINKGQELTDETPFRDYVQKIDDIETGVDTSDATALASDLLKGKTAYNAEGKIEGTLELKDGDVKLFETQEEMQSDPNAQEGDLAVVYREEIQSATVNSQFQTAIFPETVVLDEAVTDYIDIRYRAIDDSIMFDCWGSLDSSRFRMDCYTESGSIRIAYTSEDGITYTRTDTTGNPVDFGCEIHYEYSEYWNDAIGKFIQCGGSTFEGLYEYNTNLIDENKYHFPLLANLDLSTSNISIQASDYDSTIYTVEWLKTFSEKIATDLGFEQTGNFVPRFFLTTTDELCFITKDDGFTFTACPLVDSSNNVVGFGSNDLSLQSLIRVYKVTDVENMTYSLYNTYTGVRANGSYTYFLMSDINSVTIQHSLNSNKLSCDSTIMVFDGTNIKTSYRYIQDINVFILYDAYLYAATQLTLSNPNELLPGKIAYGKNGVVEGNDSLYDNLDANKVLTKLLNVPEEDLTFDVNLPIQIDDYAIESKLFLNKGDKTLDIENGKAYHLSNYNILEKESNSFALRLNCNITPITSYDSTSHYTERDFLNRYIIDRVCTATSNTDTCITYITIMDFFGNKIKEFSIDNSKLSNKLAYYFFGNWAHLSYSNNILFSSWANGSSSSADRFIVKYDLNTKECSKIYTGTEMISTLFYDADINILYGYEEVSGYVGNVYQFNTSTGAKTQLASSAGCLIACSKGISYNIEGSIKAKKKGSTNWFTGTSHDTPVRNLNGYACRSAFECSDGMYAITFAIPNYASTVTRCLNKIDFVNETTEELRTNMPTLDHGCGGLSGIAYDKDHIYMSSASGALLKYDYPSNQWIQLNIGSFNYSTNNSLTLNFTDVDNEFNFTSRGLVNNIYTYYNCNIKLYNFEKGMDNSSINFITNSRGERNFLLGARYGESGPISQEEYNTALDTAYSIRDDQVE